MLAFQVENFKEIMKELAPLFRRHWEESALDKEQIKLAPDWERYVANQDQGILHVVTARCASGGAVPGSSHLDHDRKKSGSTAHPDRRQGRLVGYHMAFILPHLHYRNAGPMAYPDAYYILPEFRKGGAGARLFAAMERTLWEKGVTKIYMSTKVHSDHGPLLELMGYKLTDKVYTKLKPKVEN